MEREQSFAMQLKKALPRPDPSGSPAGRMTPTGCVSVPGLTTIPTPPEAVGGSRCASGISGDIEALVSCAGWWWSFLKSHIATHVCVEASVFHMGPL